jgi:hypothetical protein
LLGRLLLLMNLEVIMRSWQNEYKKNESWCFFPKNMKKKYNDIAKFVDSVLFNHQPDLLGFVIKTDMKVIAIKSDANVDLKFCQDQVGGFIEIASYVEDDNYEVIVDEEGILKSKPFNLMAYFITGYEFYGDVLFLKRGVLK